MMSGRLPTVDFQTLLPDWSRAEFLVLEQQQRWAAAVAAEFRTAETTVSSDPADPRQQSGGSGPQVRFVSLPTSREIVSRLGTITVPGIIAVLTDAERETLVLLGRLARLSRQGPPVLVVGEERHRELIPVLYETGASSVLTERPTDIQIAGWCQQVLAGQR